MTATAPVRLPDPSGSDVVFEFHCGQGGVGQADAGPQACRLGSSHPGEQQHRRAAGQANKDRDRHFRRDAAVAASGSRKAAGGVEQFEAIRRPNRDEGLGVRALAARFGVHRRTVRAALLSATPAERKVPERDAEGMSAERCQPWPPAVGHTDRDAGCAVVADDGHPRCP